MTKEMKKRFGSWYFNDLLLELQKYILKVSWMFLYFEVWVPT